MIFFQTKRLIVREFHPADIAPISKNVRDIDREDIETLFNVTPEESVRLSTRNSTFIFTIVFDHQMVAILGLMPETLLSDKALVWMVTTHAINRVPISFLKGSREFLNELFKLYKSFYGIVRNENVCSKKWLEWLGATMIPNDELGFHHFTLGEN